MKIYNKSGFGWGLFLTAIGLAMLATSIWTGFDIKGTILMAACLVLGATFRGRSLSHAMSREDKGSKQGAGALAADGGAAHGTGLKLVEQIAKSHGGGLELRAGARGVLGVVRIPL